MKLTLSILSAALLVSIPGAFAADAGATYKKHCASCHGADGKGQTKMGKQSGAVDYTTAKGQSWGDAQGVQIILNGKGKMKGFASKGITDADAKALVSFIRKFK